MSVLKTQGIFYFKSAAKYTSILLKLVLTSGTVLEFKNDPLKCWKTVSVLKLMAFSILKVQLYSFETYTYLPVVIVEDIGTYIFGNTFGIDKSLFRY